MSAHTGTPFTLNCVRSVLLHCCPMAQGLKNVISKFLADWWAMSCPTANISHYCTKFSHLGNLVPGIFAPCPSNFIVYFAWCWSTPRQKRFLSRCVARRSESSSSQSEPLFLLRVNRTWYIVGTEVLIGAVLSGEIEALSNISCWSGCLLIFNLLEEMQPYNRPFITKSSRLIMWLHVGSMK